jgi:hypothetical protein
MRTWQITIWALAMFCLLIIAVLLSRPAGAPASPEPATKSEFDNGILGRT